MHENAGNIGLRLDYYAHIINELDLNVLTFAYRGYSESEGTPDEVGLKEDGLDIMRYTRDNRD